MQTQDHSLPPASSFPQSEGPAIHEGTYNGAIDKPKQSKSRSGCATCKQKRLKCDETKPTCLQCQKRKVECAGYQKDFKWKAFADTNAKPKPRVSRKSSVSNISLAQQRAEGKRQAGTNEASLEDALGDVSNEFSFSSAWPPDHDFEAFPNDHDLHGEYQGRVSPTTSRRPEHVSPIARFLSTFTTEGASVNNTRPPSSSGQTTKLSTSENDSAVSFSMQSPQFDFSAGGDMEHSFDWSGLQKNPSSLTFRPAIVRAETSRSTTSNQISDDERGPLERDTLLNRTISFDTTPIPARKQITSSHLDSITDMSIHDTTSGFNLTPPNKQSPHYDLALEGDADQSWELMIRFDEQTCGILSVVEGPVENPWRSLVRPMAGECPALYHAIMSMAAFHGAHDSPTLHTSGMAHMTESMRCLAGTLHNMPLDYAFATSLALSFSEGWDSHVSTGVQHLRAASVMAKNILIRHRQEMESGQLTSDGADRVRFLCNTFVYMEVIARLTSFNEVSDIDLEDVLVTVNGTPEDEFEIDPLMGCAMTLFPLIGRVADLVQRVYKSESNSLTLVSKAMELKEQIERWQAPHASAFEKPIDLTLDVQHLIQTAEAYRYATLLYLHQAVPEIPSESAEKLAKKVLFKLASVPLSSGAILVHIFPLFAASCEVTDPEDRSWVIERWTAMTRRLKIGNIKSCWGVVQELWSRRDVAETEKANRVLRRNKARGPSSDSSSAVEIPLSLKRKVSTIDEANERNVVYRESRQQLGESRSTLSRSWASDSGDLATIFGNTRRPLNNASTSSTQLEYEYTVRGSLHWLGVMADWRWEVFL